MKAKGEDPLLPVVSGHAERQSLVWCPLLVQLASTLLLGQVL